MNYLQIAIALMKGTPLGDFANKLEQDLKDGSLQATEIPGLIEAIAPAAEQFFPKDSPYIQLAIDVAAAVDKFMATQAHTPATPAPPAVAAA